MIAKRFPEISTAYPVADRALTSMGGICFYGTDAVDESLEQD